MLSAYLAKPAVNLGVRGLPRLLLRNRNQKNESSSVRWFTEIETSLEDQLTLTKEEALSYLENVLGIPDPISSMQKNKFDFLCEMHFKTKHVQAFTNANFIREGNLRTLTVDECKQNMLNKQGGGCIQINFFTKSVLQQMGYQTYIAGAVLPIERVKAYEGHYGIVVQDLTKEGSLHLVEPGSIHPIVKPIPLDFKRVSPEYQLVSYPVRLFKDSPGIVRLCMPAENELDSKESADTNTEDGKTWKTLMRIRILQPQSWIHSDRIMAPVLSNDHLLPDKTLRTQLVIFGFSSNGLWTVVKGKTFVQYSKDGEESVVQRLKTDKDVVENTRKHFPQFSHQSLAEALEFYQKKRLKD